MTSHGFALLAVLWTLTLLAGAAGLGAAAARLGQRTTANRIAMTRGRWAAEACLAMAEARAVEHRLTDTATIDLGRSTTCAWRVEYPDAGLDANHAPGSALERLALGVGVAPDSARQLAAAVVEKRRKGALTDVRQLSALPGADLRVLPHLTVDGSGRVDTHTASPVVLASLPGMTAEAAELMVRQREAGRPVANVDQLSGGLSPAGRAALHAGYADLVPMIAFGSTRVRLTATGWISSYGRYPEATIEVVAERLPYRLAVLRRRMR